VIVIVDGKVGDVISVDYKHGIVEATIDGKRCFFNLVEDNIELCMDSDSIEA